MQVDTTAGGHPPRELRRARLATATLFFANGCKRAAARDVRRPVRVRRPLFVMPRGRLAARGAVALVAFMAEAAMGDWSAICLRMDLGATPATAAWGFAAFSLTMTIGRLTGDRLVARFGSAGMGSRAH